jgi:serine protease AprX
MISRCPRALITPIAAVLALALAAVCAPAVPAARAASASPAPGPETVAAEPAGGDVGVIVRQRHPAASSPRTRLADLGGTVTRELPIVGGFAATLPADAVGTLAADPGVAAVERDLPLSFRATTAPDQTTPAPVAAAPSPAAGRASVHRQVVGADRMRGRGATGQGVTVALIDTGVTEVGDLRGRLVRVGNDTCQNLSGEAGCDDGYGHGTFMAGLIAGSGAGSGGRYAGVAPGARVLSVKIAGRDGSADVSKLLAALQWVVSYKDRYRIKVLNLSLGTDSIQSWRSDPLNYAVERAWAAGITVVVAAGNLGPRAGTVTKPADDPWVLTTGAVDDLGTAKLTDDLLPDFSGRGPARDGVAKPDLAAPGAHLVSLRAPGSTIERAHPGPGAYRRGSGTSMAAAVVSGAAALVLSARPSWTPDRLKHALTTTAERAATNDRSAVGRGVADAYAAAFASAPGTANRGLARSTGRGPLDASRGSVVVRWDTPLGPVVSGASTAQQVLLTLQLATWDPAGYTTGDWSERTWPTGPWALHRFVPTVWDGDGPSGRNWQGRNWQGASFYGRSDTRPSYGPAGAGSSWYGTWG